MKVTLHSFEIENFKTYRGLVTIGPLKDFMSVIGPNGAGKSNLLDALSFALGEKVTNLRAKESKDLIHGAHVGKPVSDKASVTVYFRFEDKTFAAFKRTISSKSPGRFSLNNKTVPKAEYLKELDVLGINVKAKNFLVFQGMIESIALMDSKQRTALLEEISGSLSYKNDYDESKMQMNVFEDNIHMTFSNQRACRNEYKEAKLEKKEAMKYEMQKRELENKILKLQLVKLFLNEKDIESLKDEILSQKDKIKSNEETKLEAEELVKQLKKSSGKAKRELFLLEQKDQEYYQQMRKIEEPLLQAKEEESHICKTLEKAEASLKQAQKVHEKHIDTMQALRKELAAIEKEQKEYQEKVAEESLSQGINIDLEESMARDYSEKKGEAVRRAATVSQEIDSLMRELKAYQDRLENEQRNCLNIENKIKYKEQEKGDELIRSEKLSERKCSNEKDLKELIDKRQTLEGNWNLFKETIVSIQDELKDLNAKISEADLHKEIRNTAMKQRAVIENLKGLFPGVMGRLIDLCQPVHQKYFIAITKVTGKFMNAIVVEKEVIARHCIQFLKEQRMGPEIFLPLDFIEVKPLQESLRLIKNPKNTHLLYDVVKYDSPQLKKAVLFVTKNVLVCETAEDAMQVASGSHSKSPLDVVSLDGTYFQRSGLISGGHADLAFKAKRWDEKIIVHMHNRKEELSKSLHDILKKSNSESELCSLETEIKGITCRIDFMKKDLAISFIKVQSIEEEIEKLKLQLQDCEPKVNGLKEEITKRERCLKKLNQKLHSIEDEVFADFCHTINVPNIRTYEESGLKSYEERTRKLAEMEDRKNRIKNLLDYEKTIDTQSNIDRWTIEVESRKSTLASAKLAYEVHEKAVADIKNDIKNNGESVAMKLEEIKSLENYAKEAGEHLKSISDTVLMNGKKLLVEEHKLEVLWHTRGRLLLQCKVENIAVDILQGNLDALAGGISETTTEYSNSVSCREDSQAEIRNIQIGYDLLESDFQDLTRANAEGYRSALAEEVESLSRAVEACRAPNWKSTDRMETTAKNLKERSEQLKIMQNKGRKVKSAFVNAKKKRFDSFMHCFDFVSNEIDTIYKELTQASSAAAFLSAADPEEPYLSGVSYNCVVPGKACQPMETLSGGEKTLASIALLIALHKYRAPPILVLDEVDAALDSANITRIVSYFRNHKEHFQTITISLRPEFYGHVDGLIGVTSRKTSEYMSSEVFLFDLEVYPDQV